MRIMTSHKLYGEKGFFIQPCVHVSSASIKKSRNTFNKTIATIEVDSSGRGRECGLNAWESVFTML